MGVVYEAVELALDRVVAFKVIAPGLAADDDFRERFVTESRVAASIDHPNVVPIFQAGDDHGVLFLAMRFVTGDDLGTIVRRDGPLDPVRAARVVAHVAGALDAAHRRRLVHRDVKPANVLIDEDGHVYLTDFGLAKLDAAGGQTRTGFVVGTPDYFAPEQIRGEQIGPWTDIYGLGCLLFYALTGRVVYALEHTEAKLWAHLSERPPSATALRPEVPAELDEVIRVALAKQTEERFQTASALGAAAQAAVSLRRGEMQAPLVGRTEELAQLRSLWASVRRDGNGRVVVITGPSGIGKSRLGEEFRHEAQRDGDAMSLPGDASEALGTIAEVRGAARPTVLVADDFDRAPGEVLAALAEVAGAAAPVLVLVTGVDPETFASLRHDAWLELDRLDTDALGQIARLYGDGDTGSLDRALAASDGVPRHVHEVAEEWARAQAAGRIKEAATRAAAGRREWRDAESQLTGTIIARRVASERAAAAAGRSAGS